MANGADAAKVAQIKADIAKVIAQYLDSFSEFRLGEEERAIVHCFVDSEVYEM
jgi:hypothetical protein